MGMAHLKVNSMPSQTAQFAHKDRLAQLIQVRSKALVDMQLDAQNSYLFTY
jgi:hypothetical protein